MNEFKEGLKQKMDEYAHLVYKITKAFPSDEKYGLTSQWRRATMSIVLNYVEWYARFKDGYKIQFCENSYGSFQESKYLLNFCYEEKLISEVDYNKANAYLESIGAMLWTDLSNLRKFSKNS